jgi:starch phosphorylase
MKASANGALNFSVLDGWWDEAASEQVGWSIGNGEVYDDTETQDEIESGAVYDLLEHEIVPLFYDRGRDGLPRTWIRMMKEAMKGICPIFNTNRMVAEYATRCYLPAAKRAAHLHAEKFRGAKELASWLQHARETWPSVRVLEIESANVTERSVGDSVPVRARVQLGGLAPEHLSVQIYHGEVDASGDLIDAQALPMTAAADGGGGTRWFEGEMPCSRTGHRGYAIRVIPANPELGTPFVSGLIRWSSDLAADPQSVPLHS